MGLHAPYDSYEENRFALFFSNYSCYWGSQYLQILKYLIAFNCCISCILHTSNPFCASEMDFQLALFYFIFFIFCSWYYKSHILLLGSLDLRAKWQAQQQAILVQLDWTQSTLRPEKVPWRKRSWESRYSHPPLSLPPVRLGGSILKGMAARLAHWVLAYVIFFSLTLFFTFRQFHRR